jgi:hypothetical protein
MELGGPWNFYRQFWQAHGLEHLSQLVPAELTIQVGGTLSIPLIVENPTDTPIHVNLQVQTPDGWKVMSPLPSPEIDAHTKYFLRVQAAAPATKLAGWQQFVVSAESGGKTIGTVPLRVELASWALPQ